MDLKSLLDEKGFRYQWSMHADVFSAQALAAREHVPGQQVVKPVLVSADGEFVLCALPASYKIDLEELRKELGATEARLADEDDLSQVCADCELGAEPPIGWMFGLPTVIDESLFDDRRVTFQAGTHREAVTMSFLDYYRLAQPVVGHFGRRV
jgi:Ala-tRNA(Pro) deacylase